MAKKKKKSEKDICKERGYHRWEQIDSEVEDYNEMTVKAECLDCGATFEATGDWG